MRVALISSGTRGDVQPFVCLARALADIGHEVEVITPRNGEDMARAAGVNFRALPYDVQSMFRSDTAQRMLADGRVSTLLRWIGEELGPYAQETNRVLMSATESVDLIVCNSIVESACRVIAEARQIVTVPITALLGLL
jgi:sterol 3beta-glucosyltransferase